MKKSLSLLLPVIVALLSANAHAAPCGKTRADVRAEIVALEAAGWNPADNEMNYPDELRAAQRRVTAQHLQPQAAADTASCGAY